MTSHLRQALDFKHAAALLRRLLAGFALAASAAGLPHAATATEDDASALEREFWLCDHATTRGLLGLGEAARCSVATEQLRLTRFQGDFPAMLAWWREHKTAMHQALDARYAAALQRAAASRRDATR